MCARLSKLAYRARHLDDANRRIDVGKLNFGKDGLFMCSGSSGISESNEISLFVYNGSSVRTVLYIKCLLGDAQAMTRLHDCNCAEHTCAHMLGVQMNVAPMNKTGARSCDQVLYFVISGRA